MSEDATTAFLKERLGESAYAALVDSIAKKVARASAQAFAEGRASAPATQESGTEAEPTFELLKKLAAPVTTWLADRLREPSSWAANAFLIYLSDNIVPAMSQYSANKWGAAAAAFCAFVISEVKQKKGGVK